MPSVLFVCLGNICRSPMAEGIFRKLLEERGLSSAYQVDSAGTAAYHVGKGADPRTLEVLSRHDSLCPMTARQVADDDFHRFDYILAMDTSNYDKLWEQCPAEERHRLHKALALTNKGDVPDPYWGGEDGFDHVYSLLKEAMESWLERMEAQRATTT